MNSRNVLYYVYLFRKSLFLPFSSSVATLTLFAVACLVNYYDKNNHGTSLFIVSWSFHSNNSVTKTEGSDKSSVISLEIVVIYLLVLFHNP